MQTICLFGAGKIGEAITLLLGSSGDYRIKVCDIDLERAQKVAALSENAHAFALDANDNSVANELMQDSLAVISALPYFCNEAVAKEAYATNNHYFDLTEDVSTTKLVKEIASSASTCFMPQCGIAPGFISIAAANLIAHFDSVDNVKMRVGALPIYPSNRFKYNLTWSTDGLINEYGNLCEVLINGEMCQAYPLESLEHFSLDGCEYEAFNTSGGLGSLCESMKGKVRNLTYKTIRYPGHRELAAFLMQDLGLNEDRENLKKIFERAIPVTTQDKCIVFVEAIGKKDERLLQKTYTSTIYHQIVDQHELSAIQITTAAGVCAPLDLILSNKLEFSKGFVRSEDISLELFLENRFGSYYTQR